MTENTWIKLGNVTSRLVAALLQEREPVAVGQAACAYVRLCDWSGKGAVDGSVAPKNKSWRHCTN